jgi:hypothetical protein
VAARYGVGIASEGISRTTVFNRRPITLGVQYYYNVERPEGSAGHTLRFAVTLLYPTAKH